MPSTNCAVEKSLPQSPLVSFLKVEREWLGRLLARLSIENPRSSSYRTNSNKTSVAHQYYNSEAVAPESDPGARTVPLERYIAARKQCLTSADEILCGPLGKNGAELVIGLPRSPGLRTLRRLADCKDRVTLIERRWLRKIWHGILSIIGSNCSLRPPVSSVNYVLPVFHPNP